MTTLRNHHGSSADDAQPVAHVGWRTRNSARDPARRS